MRRISSFLLAWIACAVAAAPATAATLPFEADLVVKMGSQAAYSVGTVGSGVAIVNGSGGFGPLTNLALPAGFVATALVEVPVTDPAASPIQGFQLQVGNGAGSFAIGGNGLLGGVMPLPGFERFCLFGSCPVAVANLTVPLTPVGAGGFATQPGAVNLTVNGAPWTTGTVMAQGLGTSTFTGYAQGPASAPSSTARPGGTLLLVTPFTVTTNIASDGPLSGFAFLTLRFVPEPASAIFLGTGLALLSGLGRQRLGG